MYSKMRVWASSLGLNSNLSSPQLCAVGEGAGRILSLGLGQALPLQDRSEATGYQLSWTQLLGMICRSLLPALPFWTNKQFPKTWQLSSFSIPLIKEPPKIVHVLLRFEEKEINFNWIPHLFSAAMDLWHVKADSSFCCAWMFLHSWK